jgi:hypothetical protein
MAAARDAAGRFRAHTHEEPNTYEIVTRTRLESIEGRVTAIDAKTNGLIAGTFLLVVAEAFKLIR